MHNLNRPKRVINFKFVGPTNYKGSRVIIQDVWHNQRVTLPLNGADMWVTVRDYIEGLGFNILNYGWTNQSTDKGCLMVDDFAKRLK